MDFIELCAGAGGLALGLEQAGFKNLAAVDNDPGCCETLTLNRPNWNAVEVDIRHLKLRREDSDIELLSAGLPNSPTWEIGSPENLFERVLDMNVALNPAVLLVVAPRDVLSPRNDAYASHVRERLVGLGYHVYWETLDAATMGVAQHRKRAILVAFRAPRPFRWPEPTEEVHVGPLLYDLMAADGWAGAREWAAKADVVGPSIVGGSALHGGPDLGPSGSRNAWARIGVDALGVAEAPPARGFIGRPRLTMAMVARLQGFPDNWQFAGNKTHRYRQIGNAYPAPAARAIGGAIAKALDNRVGIATGGTSRAAR